MLILRYCFFLLLLICAWATAHAQDSLTLQTAVRQAVTHHTGIKKAELDVQIMRDRGRMEQSIIYPQVSGNFGLDYFPVLPTSLVPGEFVNQPGTFIPVQFGQPWQSSGGITVQQLLFNESYRRAIPARQLSVALSSTLLEKGKEEVAFQIAQLMLQIKQTEAMQTALVAHQTRVQALEKAVKASVDNGFSVKTDLGRIQLAAQQLTDQQHQLRDAIAYQRDLLGFLMGTPIDSAVGISLAGLQTTTTAQAVTTRPTVEARLLDQGMALQRLQLRTVEAEKYPDVRAYATGLVQSQSQNAPFFARDNRWFGMGAVGVKAHFPIYDGGRLRQRVKQIRSEISKNELDRQRLTDYQTIEVRNAERAIRAAQEQITLAQASVQLNNDIYTASRNQYREGTLPLKEVLDAQTVLAEAETQLATRQIGLLMAQVKWRKAAGFEL